MKLIAHRINTIDELQKLPKEYGVEIDLRDRNNGGIHIAHDPFIEGECFEEYLKNYNHGLMILNIKSERIEHKVLELIKKYNIKKYFFLDSSFPMIYSLSKQGENNIAIRFSEFEGMDTIRKMKGLVDWVWVDCFTELPLDYDLFCELKDMNYKLCLVSPELQGRNDDIDFYKEYLAINNIAFDAICTKHYNFSRWTK